MGHIVRSDTARHSNLLKESEINSFDFMTKEDSFDFIPDEVFLPFYYIYNDSR